MLTVNISPPSQALKEQVSSLQAQIKEQEVKVKAAAPDKKQLDDLQKKVDAYRKGQYVFFFWRLTLVKLFVLTLFDCVKQEQNLLKCVMSFSMESDDVNDNTVLYK